MRLIDGMRRVVEAIAFVMFATMFALALAQVLFRYFLHIPAPWTEEVARALFVLATLSGIALAYHQRQHIIVDFLFVQFSQRVKRWLSIGFAVTILMFLALWARGAVEMIGRNWTVSLITVGWFRVAYYYVWELAMIELLATFVLLDLRNLVTGRTSSLQSDDQGSNR